MISAQKLSRRFSDGERGSLTVLDEVDLKIEAGEFVAIIGRSGTGKSTLLHILGGLDTQFLGEVNVAETSLRGLNDSALARFRNQTVGFVFQSFHLLQGLNASANVALPRFFGAASGDADAALERVGLKGMGHRQPSQLSGGERQRVAIARALYSNPKVLLCDEPTGNLDASTGDEIIELFKTLNVQGLTLLTVTHEPKVSSAAHRVLELKDGKLQRVEQAR